jgi:hypothetical protein
MTVHRFTVNLPNPDSQRASVELRLEPVRPKELSWLRHEGLKTPLKVASIIMTTDPCAERGEPKLALDLDPFRSVDVHVVVTTAPTGQPGVTAFHLIDRRGGKDAGGVLLVCADPPFAEPKGQVVSTPNPCPIVLAKDLYAIQPGDDPARSVPQPIVAGRSIELVAHITNPTRGALKETRAYLEHLGGSGAEFAPGTWNAGTLLPGGAFFVTWLVRARPGVVGAFKASVVVESLKKDPVRLSGMIAITRDDR